MYIPIFYPCVLYILFLYYNLYKSMETATEVASAKMR
jgi:hypothetical protein